MRGKGFSADTTTLELVMNLWCEDNLSVKNLLDMPEDHRGALKGKLVFHMNSHLDVNVSL